MLFGVGEGEGVTDDPVYTVCNVALSFLIRVTWRR